MTFYAHAVQQIWGNFNLFWSTCTVQSIHVGMPCRGPHDHLILFFLFVFSISVSKHNWAIWLKNIFPNHSNTCSSFCWQYVSWYLCLIPQYLSRYLCLERSSEMAGLTSQRPCICFLLWKGLSGPFLSWVE